MLINLESLPQTLPFFDQVYHDQIVAQHNQYYFYNKLHDFEKAGTANRNNFQPLNVANLHLGRFLKKTVAELSADYSLEVVGELKSLLKEWQDYYNRGGTFDTFKYVSEMVSKLESIGYPISKMLTESNGLHNDFINIPYATKAFFQISVMVPESCVLDFLKANVTYLNNNKSILYYIKEFTICNWVARVGSVEDNTRLYTMKYIMNPTIVNSHYNPIIQIVSKQISELLPHYEADFIVNPYSQEFYKNIFVYQGSTNYKKFLNLLGILGDVYDVQSDYAFLRFKNGL